MEFHKKREDKAKVRFQMWLALAKRTLTRRGSRINTDRFPERASKTQASRGSRHKAANMCLVINPSAGHSPW